MARRKNTKRFDPRYFMDEKTDIIKEEMKDYYGGEAHSQSKADAAMPRRGSEEDYSDRLLDLAGEVGVLASRADDEMRNVLLNLQGELEAIASKMRY